MRDAILARDAAPAVEEQVAFWAGGGAVEEVCFQHGGGGARGDSEERVRVSGDRGLGDGGVAGVGEEGGCYWGFVEDLGGWGWHL